VPGWRHHGSASAAPLAAGTERPGDFGYGWELETSDITIEERSPDEVNWVWGEDEEGELTRVRISARDTPARNPSFDVTPAKYIKGIITEAGVLAPPYGRSIRRAISGKRRGSRG